MIILMRRYFSWRGMKGQLPVFCYRTNKVNGKLGEGIEKKMFDGKNSGSAVE